MARYDSTHKARSRAAIIDAAAGLFRRHGYRGVGIDAVCRAAGLTRGAFYAHFASKQELLDAVLGGAHDLVRRLGERAGETPQQLAATGAAVMADYLAVSHRNGVLGGCSLSALAMDTVRGGDRAQQAYASAVTRIVAELERGGVATATAQAALAMAVGGLLVGAACGDAPVGDEVANAAREATVNMLLEARAKA